MATKINPHTTVLTEREVTRMKRPMNQVMALGGVLRAARNARGKAMTKVMAVPSVAIWMVSIIGSAMRPR